jgi:Gpi18-like mannosyltransferase
LAGNDEMRVRTFFVLAIVAREVFSFWTGHPYDFELWVRTGYWVVRGVSPYGLVPPAPGVSFVSNISAGGNPTIAYLPFWPLLLGGLYEVYALLGSASPFVYYFLIKQPIIICDVLLAYFLYRYVEKRGSNQASFVLKLWLFSPFNIVLSAIWGMWDAIPMLFVVLALSVRPGAYRGIWSGVATFAKSIPLIYAIPLARGPKPLRNLALALGIPVVASLAIVWLAGWEITSFQIAVQSTLARGGSSLSLWETAYYLNSVGVISNSALNLFISTGYLWIPAVAIATLVAYRWFGFETERGMIQSMLLITLTFLLLRGVVNEQYALYLYALALIDVALWSPQRKRVLLAGIAVVLMFNVTNVLLFIRYVAPVFPQALTMEANIVAAIYPERTALLFLEAVAFWAVEIYYFYSLVKERHLRTEDALLAA